MKYSWLITLLVISTLMLSTSYALTFEEAVYKYGNNPEKIIDHVNEVMPATRTNCRPVSEYVFRMMNRWQYSELYLVGVWTRTKGHCFVTFSNRWGELYMITNGQTEDGLRLQLIKVDGDSIYDICDYWNPDWILYRIYTKDMKCYAVYRRSDE